jgi:Skp family chaperone for outer membrane proteins
MKKINLIFCLSLLFAVTNIASASEMKIAVVDLMKIEENSLIVKDMMKKFNAQETKLRNILEDQKKSLEEKYKNLEAKKSVLSRESLESQVREIEKNFLDLQKEEKIYSQTLEVTKMTLLQTVQQDVKYAVEKVANNDEYDMIISSSALLYLNHKKVNDITPDVLDALNNKSKTVDFDTVYKKVHSEVNDQIKKAIKNADSSNKNKGKR